MYYSGVMMLKRIWVLICVCQFVLLYSIRWVLATNLLSVKRHNRSQSSTHNITVCLYSPVGSIWSPVICFLKMILSFYFEFSGDRSCDQEWLGRALSKSFSIRCWFIESTWLMKLDRRWWCMQVQGFKLNRLIWISEGFQRCSNLIRQKARIIVNLSTHFSCKMEDWRQSFQVPPMLLLVQFGKHLMRN